MFHVIETVYMNVKNLTDMYLQGKLNVEFDTTCKSDQAIIMTMIMGLPREVFGKPVDVAYLKERLGRTLKGRGLAGERLRELMYMYGFDIYTRSMDRQLKNMQMRITGPFPVNPPNPRRTVVNLLTGNGPGPCRCFTCGRYENEADAMGQPIRFEKGHLDPHNHNTNASESSCMMQCLHCNKAYKDYVAFDSGKPSFNLYAIMRDSSRSELMTAMKRLKIDSSMK